MPELVKAASRVKSFDETGEERSPTKERPKRDPLPLVEWEVTLGDDTKIVLRATRMGVSYPGTLKLVGQEDRLLYAFSSHAGWKACVLKQA